MYSKYSGDVLKVRIISPLWDTSIPPIYYPAAAVRRGSRREGHNKRTRSRLFIFVNHLKFANFEENFRTQSVLEHCDLSLLLDLTTSVHKVGDPPNYSSIICTSPVKPVFKCFFFPLRLVRSIDFFFHWQNIDGDLFSTCTVFPYFRTEMSQSFSNKIDARLHKHGGTPPIDKLRINNHIGIL